MAEVHGEIAEFNVEVEPSVPLTATANTSPLNVTEDDPNAAYQYELLSCLNRLDNNTYGLQAIKNAFVTLQTALQGNDTTATLTALKQAIAAIGEAGLTVEDKVWLTNKFNSITIDLTPVAKEATLNTAKTEILNAMPSIAGLATEANATANRTALSNAIAGLQGSSTSATLTAIYTIVGAITSGLTNADKTWLLQQFAAIDLSAITSRLDNSTYGLNALKTAIAAIAIPYDQYNALAKDATVAKEATTASKTDISVLATQSSLNGLHSKVTSVETTLDGVSDVVDSISSDTAAIKTETDKIGTATSATNDTLFKAIENINFDTTDLAKEATLGTSNDTAANATIFGKIANLLATWNSWISGAWATLVSNVTAIKSKTDNIGTPSDTSSASTLFGKVAAIPTTQPTDYAKQGSNPDINFTTLNAKMDTVIGTGITEITTQAITEIVNRVITEDSESE